MWSDNWGLADVAGEIPATDGRGIRVERYASGRGSEVGDLDPPVNRDARVQMVDDVPIGPRVDGFVDRDVDKPDAEYRRRAACSPPGGSGERWGERGGGTVSTAAASINAPRNRRTIPPAGCQDTQ